MRFPITRREVSAGVIVLSTLTMAGCAHHVARTPAPPAPVAASVPAPPPTEQGTGIAVGSPAPNFTTVTTKGKPLSLAALRGHVVLLDYWATWCGTCRKTMPSLETLYRQRHSQGLDVVGISVDDPSTVATAPAVARHLGVTYTLSASAVPNARAGEAYDIAGLPAMFLIDKQGIVRWKSGDEITMPFHDPVLQAKIHQLLSEPTAVTSNPGPAPSPGGAAI